MGQTNSTHCQTIRWGELDLTQYSEVVFVLVSCVSKDGKGTSVAYYFCKLPSRSVL